MSSIDLPAVSRPETPTGAPARPPSSPLASYDAAFLVALNVAVVTFMWFRHDGLGRSGNLDEWLVSVGQLTGLYAALSVILGLVLVSRAPWLERRYGMDQMLRAHRLTGFAPGWLMLTHVLTSTIGLARDTNISLWDQIVDYWRNYDYLVGAIVGFGLFVVVVVMSIRAARRRLSYEAWWLIHLATYAAAALAFGHQTAIGADFVLDGWAFAYWVVLWTSVSILVLGYRWIALGRRLVRQRLHIGAVEAESPGVVTLVVEGRGLESMRPRPANSSSCGSSIVAAGGRHTRFRCLPLPMAGRCASPLGRSATTRPVCRPSPRGPGSLLKALTAALSTPFRPIARCSSSPAVSVSRPSEVW